MNLRAVKGRASLDIAILSFIINSCASLRYYKTKSFREVLKRIYRKNVEEKRIFYKILGNIAIIGTPDFYSESGGGSIGGN